MIKSFRNKGLDKLWSTGASKIDRRMHERIGRRLDTLNEAIETSELNLPGYNFHKLAGKLARYTIHINGPWCITFEFEGGDASNVDFEQYH
ncbi:proteic killer suppression protein [Bradyrhizobium japonicum]